MPLLTAELTLDRCPHCGVDSPMLPLHHNLKTSGAGGARFWGVYACRRCGGVIVASAPALNGVVTQIIPPIREVDAAIPDIARQYLTQAIDSSGAPAGAVMLAASSVDAMLKAKGYNDGSLYSRIDRAVEDHLITKEMGLWAHEVRLEANGQRHADETFSMPTSADAGRVIAFAQALGEFLFGLPMRVSRGRSSSP